MGLQIAVCIKSVPDPKYYGRITIDAKTKTIKRQGILTIINPGDKNALEEALRIKEQYGGKITVISMAPPEGKREIYEAMAMGADEGILLSDRAFAGADTLATSYTIAQGIRKMDHFDLVLTGTESADGATSQVPAQLGEWLEIPHLWNVKEFSFTKEREINAKVKMDHGVGEYLIQLPALLAVSREINKPRYITAAGIVGARKKPLVIISKKELNADDSFLGQTGSPTWAGDVVMTSLGRKGQQLTGTPEEIVEQLLRTLRTAGIKLKLA